MAIVAGRNTFVAAMVPAVVDLAHYMTVRTCRGIVGEVRVPPRIHEGKAAKAKEAAGRAGKEEEDPERRRGGMPIQAQGERTN